MLTSARALYLLGSIWASALIILWSQVQVLVGPPERQTLISNDGGFKYLHNEYQRRLQSESRDKSS